MATRCKETKIANCTGHKLKLTVQKRNIFIVTTQFTIKLKDCHILYTEHTGSLHACVATNKTIKVFKNKKSKFSGENSTQN